MGLLTEVGCGLGRCVRLGHSQVDGGVVREGEGGWEIEELAEVGGIEVGGGGREGAGAARVEGEVSRVPREEPKGVCVRSS